MLIAQITSGFRPTNGGQEILIQQMNDLFEELGHKVDTFQLDNGWVEENNLILVKDPFRFIKTRERTKIGLLTLSKKYNLNGYDVVIFHYAVSWLPHFLKRKAIIFSHGIEWDENKRSVKRSFKEWLCRYSYKRSPQIYTVSNDINYLKMVTRKNIFVKPFEKYQDGVWYVPNPVNIEKIENGIPIENIQKLNCILMPRNIVYERGLHLILQAFARVIEKYPDINLLVAGEIWYAKTNDYGKYISKLIRDLKLGGRIFFLGSIPWETMPNYYKSSTITVLATIIGEGTSLAALESMAARTPVISTNVGGLSDLPTLKADANSESLTEKILFLLNDANYERIRKEQYNFVYTNFNKKNWSLCWRTILQEFDNKNEGIK